MANLRTTVILKTDIVDSTPKIARLSQAEMGLQRKQHKRFISEIAAQHHGSIFQEEGDAYWVEFPSVTTAVLAAIEMHQGLRTSQGGKGENQRLAIRVAITVGDILYQEGDSIGTTMSLTARIEKITPPDEIYLSHAAWLILNKAEVQTSFVNEFQLKGFGEPEKVYKVNQKHGIRVLTDQCIVIADAKGFTDFCNSQSTDAVEEFLLEYDELMNDVCAKHGGVIRQVNGDLYFMTFEAADLSISAIRVLCMKWKRFIDRYGIGMSMGAHKGNLNLFRSYVFGDDINTTMHLSELSRLYTSDDDKIFVSVSGEIRDEVHTKDEDLKFEELEVETLRQESNSKFLRGHPVYRLVVQC